MKIISCLNECLILCFIRGLDASGPEELVADASLLKVTEDDQTHFIGIKSYHTKMINELGLFPLFSELLRLQSHHNHAMIVLAMEGFYWVRSLWTL